jgi:hypothetical protein
MTATLRGMALVLAMVFVASCADEDDNWGNPTRVCEAPDGACWEWDCDEGGCDATPTEEVELYPECDEGEELGLTRVWGQFFSLCLGCRIDGGPTFTMEHFCRPLICERDGDCPRFEGYRFECAGGLCQSTDEEQWPREPLMRNDALTLCFAAFRRSETGEFWSPTAEDVYDDIDAACPGEWNDPCTGELPDYCWDPTDG